MNPCDVIRRLHQHRMWVNQRLLEVTRSLTNDQRHERFAIGQGSVWKTLTHLLAAEYVWLEALRGNDNPLFRGDNPEKLPGNQEDEGAIESFDELATIWAALDQRWNEYLLELTDASLDELTTKLSTSSGRGRRHATRRVDVLLHLCTHAQYTAAQLINMLRQLGQTELPDVMLVTMARDETTS